MGFKVGTLILHKTQPRLRGKEHAIANHKIKYKPTAIFGRLKNYSISQKTSIQTILNIQQTLTTNSKQDYAKKNNIFMHYSRFKLNTKTSSKHH
jgi:hypothetical protein